MKKDVFLKTNDFAFSFQVGGILIYNGKVLLQKLQDDEGYTTIGSHVSSEEATEKR